MSRDAGGNIVSTPQLYGTTHTLAGPSCCRVRASTAASPSGDSAEALEALIDDNTRAVFCETVGNPAGNICDIEAIAERGAQHTACR